MNFRRKEGYWYSRVVRVILVLYCTTCFILMCPITTCCRRHSQHAYGLLIFNTISHSFHKEYFVVFECTHAPYHVFILYCKLPSNLVYTCYSYVHSTQLLQPSVPIELASAGMTRLTDSSSKRLDKMQCRLRWRSDATAKLIVCCVCGHPIGDADHQCWSIILAWSTSPLAFHQILNKFNNITYTKCNISVIIS